MKEWSAHLAKARNTLDGGRVLMETGFVDHASRHAYMAGFHAAMALIIVRTGKEPKTHKGTHTESARLAHGSTDVCHEHVQFLSRAYEFKGFADYGSGNPITVEAAREAIGTAGRFLATIEALLPAPVPPTDTPP